MPTTEHSKTERASQYDFIGLARAVIDAEIDAIQKLHERLDDEFEGACEAILACKGRVIISGMGKSGHISNKIAATLASTGTPAFFVHPGEALHGDLGMITGDDIVIAISNSGTTDEVITLATLVKRLDAVVIGMSGDKSSPLAKLSDFHLDIAVDKEACPMGLAPTSSTTVTLVMGDALAIALLEARGFTAEDFARSHPGGRLGKRLLVHVKDIMHSSDDIPLNLPETSLNQAILEMTGKKLGATVVVETDNTLIGIFTDGDLRRTIDHKIDLHHALVKDVMTAGCKTVHPGMLAAEALQIMDSTKINALPVVNDDNELVGALNMHDMLRAGVV